MSPILKARTDLVRVQSPAGEWLTLGLVGLLGFLVWSIGIGVLFLIYAR
jgi:hypothetical protein